MDAIYQNQTRVVTSALVHEEVSGRAGIQIGDTIRIIGPAVGNGHSVWLFYVDGREGQYKAREEDILAGSTLVESGPV